MSQFLLLIESFVKCQNSTDPTDLQKKKKSRLGIDWWCCNLTVPSTQEVRLAQSLTPLARSSVWRLHVLPPVGFFSQVLGSRSPKKHVHVNTNRVHWKLQRGFIGHTCCCTYAIHLCATFNHRNENMKTKVFGTDIEGLELTCRVFTSQGKHS